MSVSRSQALYRPSDLNLVKSSLRNIHSSRSSAVTFGGIFHGDDLAISEVFGGRTRALNNVTVPIGQGIGGRAALEGRPIGAGNYVRSNHITHEFDGVVRREAIMSIYAIPVMVDLKPRGMIYTSTRDGNALGERIVKETATLANQIGHEIKIRDEVDRRTELLDQAQHLSEPDYQGMVDAVRTAYAELIGLANSTVDQETAATIRAIAGQLERGRERSQPAPDLTARELEVLSQVAMGCSYAEVANRLSLKPLTVKGYMRTILSKLHVHNRHEAVVMARKYGLIP
ncbi:LuxR C-terminal-related transcriptional regulator [Yaniella flava]|uniref:LuxR C-terminal-related transcriptional regulator n=1 Tax=Yaniella flava TaxID=287930 RepID=A0ABN2UV12_9MICC